MNIHRIRQHLDQVERLLNTTRVRHGITEQDIKDDIEYHKNQIKDELDRPVSINLQENSGLFQPEDFENE